MCAWDVPEARSECGVLLTVVPTPREGLGQWLDEVKEKGERNLSGMGTTNSKSSRDKKGKMPTNIPPDSPLGAMLHNWESSTRTKELDKTWMIQYRMSEWTKEPIRPDSLYWPRFGSYEDWICQALNIWVNSKEPFSQEESRYLQCWVGTGGVV